MIGMDSEPKAGQPRVEVRMSNYSLFCNKSTFAVWSPI